MTALSLALPRMSKRDVETRHCMCGFRHESSDSKARRRCDVRSRWLDDIQASLAMAMRRGLGCRSRAWNDKSRYE